jgi:hypothetical protein
MRRRRLTFSRGVVCRAEVIGAGTNANHAVVAMDGSSPASVDFAKLYRESNLSRRYDPWPYARTAFV